MTHGARAWSAAAVLWALLIVVFGALPTQEMVSGVTPEREAASTLLGHFVEYLVLAALMAAALGRRYSASRRAALVMVMAVGLGVAIEVAQGFLPYRDCQLLDALVNAGGAFCGLVVFSASERLRARG